MKELSRKRWAEPQLVPELRHEYVQWAGKHAFYRWLEATERNTFYYLPQVVRNRAQARIRRETKRFAQSGLPLTNSTMEILKGQAEIAELAQWEESRWSRSPLYSITKGMTAKAARTGMTEFYLPSEFLPGDDGVIFWQSPIGTAEYFSPATRFEQDPKTGVLNPVTFASLYNFIYDDTNTPVVTAAWSKISADEIYVAFYTDAEHHFRSIGFNSVEVAKALVQSGPLILEREQVLPLNRRTPWFTSEAETRLIPTARGRARSARTLKLAADRRDAGLPMIEQMVRTFAATLIYRQYALDSRETVYAGKSAVKRMLNDGATRDVAESAVSVIKIGQPLRYRAPTRDDVAYHWTERRIIEPYFRYTQYVPATGEYRKGIFEVSGYIAGPPDAPIRNIDKVFLLGE